MYRSEFRELVRAQVGDRYVFGHEVSLSDPDPEIFDCSELVQWAFARAGVMIADGSYNQYPQTVVLVGAKPDIGDLFFLKDSSGRVHHVGICIGSDQVVEARGKDWGVVLTSVAQVNARGGIWRRHTALQQALLLDPVPEREFHWFLCHGEYREIRRHVALADADRDAKRTRKTTGPSHEHIEDAIKVVMRMDNAALRVKILKAAAL